MAAREVTTGGARQRESGLMWVGCWMLTGGKGERSWGQLEQLESTSRESYC